MKDVLGWKKFQVRDWESIKNIIALSFFVGNYFYEIESTLIEHPTIEIICQLGDGKGTVDSPVTNGTKSIKVKGLSGWTQGIYLENSLQFTDVIMSFSINIPSGNSKGKAPGSIGYGGIYISFYANSNGSYDARFNHDENIAIKNITAGSWHTLSLKVNWDKSQGELIYGSNTTGVFNFTKNDSAGWNSDISLNGNNSSETNTIYVDDIKLSKTTIE